MNGHDDPGLLARRRRLVHRVVGDAVLVRGPGCDIVRLTGSAALVWVALDEPLSVRDVEAQARWLGSVDASPEASTAIAAAVDMLLEAGLVERQPVS